MLTMCFVYFNIWQIRQARLNYFTMGLIGFGKEVEMKLLAAKSPFTFSQVLREQYADDGEPSLAQAGPI